MIRDEDPVPESDYGFAFVAPYALVRYDRVMLHPHSGWPQEAPQRGAFTQGKPRWGSLSVAHIQFH
ncbi:MAG: hypothetical protein ACYTKD_02390, partial [Planctomycetota bacterium]